MPVGRCSRTTHEDVLLTCCPPAPCERTKLSSMSSSRTPSALIRATSSEYFCVDGVNLRGERCRVLGGKRVVSRSVEQEAEVASRRLSSFAPERRLIREARHALFSIERKLDREPHIKSSMDAFRPVEPIELRGREQVRDPPDRAAVVGDHVRDAAIAR